MGQDLLIKMQQCQLEAANTTIFQLNASIKSREAGFIKHIYHVHTLKKRGLVSSGKAPLAPLQNSRFDGSFIAGIAELGYRCTYPFYGL